MNIENTLSYDEMLVLNRVALDATLKDTIDNIFIQRHMTQDDEIKGIMTELHEKLTTISENEWQELQAKLPFAIPYDDEEDEYEAETEEWSDKDIKEFVAIIQEMENESGGEDGTVAE